MNKKTITNVPEDQIPQILERAEKQRTCGSCGADRDRYRTMFTGIDFMVEGIVSMIRDGRLKLVTPCLECVEKHTGQAMSNLETAIGQGMVKATEMLSGYPDRYLLVIGHLADAADEADAWPELKQALLEARRNFQREAIYPNWKRIAELITRRK